MKQLLLVATLIAGMTTTNVADAGRPQAPPPDDLVWLALGDSYSSGEGLRYVDYAANPPDKNCERATGTTTVNNANGSRAYATFAYDAVRGDWANSTFRLLACTGAVSHEIHGQYAEWLATESRRADLITVTMGGNNLRFKDVLFGCVGLSVEGGFAAAANVMLPGLTGELSVWNLNPVAGCTVTDAELRQRVDTLTGDGSEGPGGGQTLMDMYLGLAGAMNPGGYVVVLGYPQLIEESGRWVGWWFEGNRCSRIRRADVAMLRSVAGHFNLQLYNLVERLKALPANQRNGVNFHWLDVSQIFEGDQGRHGLCTSDPWINGITVGVGGTHDGVVPQRFTRSFHPNQLGHDAIGEELAGEVDGLDWGQLQRRPYLNEAYLAGLLSCEDCELTGRVEVEHPSWGRVHLVSFGPTGNECGGVELVAVDDTGQERWRHTIDGQCYYQLNPAGEREYGSTVPSPVDTDGRIFFDYNPGRYNGVIVLEAVADGFEDFDTLPTVDNYDARFYYAEAIDSDGDGIYEIEHLVNDCYPGCAMGTVTSTVYVWSGTDFAGVALSTPTGCGIVSLGRHPADAFEITVVGGTCDDAWDAVGVLYELHPAFSGSRFDAGDYQCSGVVVGGQGRYECTGAGAITLSPHLDGRAG